VKSGGLDAMARVGNWPSSEKAEEMADRIAGRLLRGAKASWHVPPAPEQRPAAE
jgi:hypothetical protein